MSEGWALRKSTTEAGRPQLAKFQKEWAPQMESLSTPVQLFLEREEIPVSSDEENEAMADKEDNGKHTGDKQGDQASTTIAESKPDSRPRPRRRKRVRPGALKWHLKDSGDTHLIGSKEGGQKSQYVLFQVIEEQGPGMPREIHVTQVGDWWSFKKKASHLTGSTEAEEQKAEAGGGVARWLLSGTTSKSRLDQKLRDSNDGEANEGSGSGKMKDGNNTLAKSSLSLGVVTRTRTNVPKRSRLGLGDAGEDPDDYEVSGAVDGTGDDGNDFEAEFDDDDPEVLQEHRDEHETGLEDSDEEEERDENGNEINKTDKEPDAEISAPPSGALTVEAVRSIMKLYGGKISTKDLLQEMARGQKMTLKKIKKALKEVPSNKDRFRAIVERLSNVVEHNVEGRMLVLKPEFMH
mmetsp:Transcript_5380/g.9340  ORF Transcript_5380/g.9340 Transcript_5380/m.9340 type:complete len:407 (+) Transcript_5380:189-1409(+)